MIKVLYVLLAISADGNEFIIDSQVSEGDCMVAIMANPEPFKMDIGGIVIDVAALECEVQKP